MSEFVNKDKLTELLNSHIPYQNLKLDENVTESIAEHLSKNVTKEDIKNPNGIEKIIGKYTMAFAEANETTNEDFPEFLNKMMEEGDTLKKFADKYDYTYKEGDYEKEKTYEPLNDVTIKEAVNAWFTEKEEVEKIYGPISKWNTSEVTDMSALFKDKTDFNEDISNWDTSKVKNMGAMFNSATSFNQDIGGWNTSKVQNMGGMFHNASAFNQDISDWDTSNVRVMKSMFFKAKYFKQDISKWNVPKVTKITDMYERSGIEKILHYQATLNDVTIKKAVNEWFTDQENVENKYGPISIWNTSNVTKMFGLFKNKTEFNEDIRGWNTSNVEDMSYMFAKASNFNQDISKWVTTKVKDMGSMFNCASSFNQNIGEWDTSNVENMEFMFFKAINFNQDISKWNTSNVKSKISMYKGSPLENKDNKEKQATGPQSTGGKRTRKHQKLRKTKRKQRKNRRKTRKSKKSSRRIK